MPRKNLKTKLVNYRLPHESVNQLRKLAVAGETTMTGTLVELIQLAFDTHEGKKAPQLPAS